MSDRSTGEGERVRFTCKDCGKELDRERNQMDIPGLTPVRCASCTLDRMATGEGYND